MGAPKTCFILPHAKNACYYISIRLPVLILWKCNKKGDHMAFDAMTS